MALGGSASHGTWKGVGKVSSHFRYIVGPFPVLETPGIPVTGTPPMFLAFYLIL